MTSNCSPTDQQFHQLQPTQQLRTSSPTSLVSVSSYLAKLVEAELRRRGATAVGAVGEQGSEVDVAIAALLDVRTGIDELDDIAGRLARSAVAHGGSWHDVARSLGLTEKAAREEYAERPARR